MRRDHGRIAAACTAAISALAVAFGLAAAVPPIAGAAGPASLDLAGRGWGNGHGMSQYGAQNAAANKGKTAAQILDFYYPGTRSGAASGALRVQVTAATAPSVTIAARSGLRVRSVPTGASVPLARAGARFWRITAVPGSANSQLSVYTNAGGWSVVRHVGGDAEFVASTMRLYLPEGTAVYRDVLRSATDGGARRTVNVVTVEHYLLGVVPREVPASWHPQAVRAQAIAARTYAVHERDTTDRGYFDVWDTTRSQVYGGVLSEHPASNAAVLATRGVIRTHGGKPAFTQFGSSNGGWTLAGSVPYLISRQDAWDVWAGNPNALWHATVTDDAIERAWPAVGDFSAVVISKRDGRGSFGGRVTSIRVVGAKASVTVSGDQFRSALGLKSTMFVLD